MPYHVEGDLLWEIVNSNKGIDILRTLRDDGPKNVRGLHGIVGGSWTTVVERKEQFGRAGLIEIERPNGKTKLLRLTPKGERLINRIDKFFGVR